MKGKIIISSDSVDELARTLERRPTVREVFADLLDRIRERLEPKLVVDGEFILPRETELAIHFGVAEKEGSRFEDKYVHTPLTVRDLRVALAPLDTDAVLCLGSGMSPFFRAWPDTAAAPAGGGFYLGRDRDEKEDLTVAKCQQLMALMRGEEPVFVKIREHGMVYFHRALGPVQVSRGELVRVHLGEMVKAGLDE